MMGALSPLEKMAVRVLELAKERKDLRTQLLRVTEERNEDRCSRLVPPN